VFAEDADTYYALRETNLDLRALVFLPPEASGSISATQRVAAAVTDLKFEAQKVSFETAAPASSMVAVSQTYYPAWQARVDGRPVKLWRANHGFQALQVPSGKHHVTLTYQDRALTTGAALSGLGLAICLGLWLRAQVKTRAAAAALASASSIIR